MPFPYFEILKKSYELTVKNFWLWFFGLFIGGTANLNLGGLNYTFLLSPGQRNFEFIREQYAIIISWIAENFERFLLFVFLTVVIGAALLVVKGISHAAVIWTATQFSRKIAGKDMLLAEVNFRSSFYAGIKYLWRIIGLQIAITIAFFVLLAVIAAPIIYLFVLGNVGRAVVLLLFGMVIFVPASLVFGFLHLYGPIFIVAFDTRIKEAVLLSFDLLRHKLKESIILASVLVGLSALFIFGLIFSIILVSFPIALFGLFLAKLGFYTAIYALLFSGAALGIVFVAVLSAGFTIFQNIVWVLAVEHMVKTRRFEAKDEDKALAAEAA